jgi:hypothetical protein
MTSVIWSAPGMTGAEDVHTVVAELPQPLHQRLSCVIAVLIDVLETFGRPGFDADTCAFDLGRAHRVEERLVFRGFHRDLPEKDHVGRPFRQPCHQFESLGPQCSELFQPLLVLVPSRHRSISQCHRVEVVVGQCDEPKPAAP